VRDSVLKRFEREGKIINCEELFLKDDIVIFLKDIL